MGDVLCGKVDYMSGINYDEDYVIMCGACGIGYIIGNLVWCS